MRQKELVSKKILELKNFIIGQRSLISTARWHTDELFQQLDKIDNKLLEIEVLINRENQDWN